MAPLTPRWDAIIPVVVTAHAQALVVEDLSAPLYYI